MRLITRADFDGLVCAAILEELGIVNDILYVHPKDLQDNKIKVTENDVIANAPLVDGCGLWFDHHYSEHERLNLSGRFTGASEIVPSAAQVIFDYYKKKIRYHQLISKFEELVAVAGIVDSAQFSRKDILNPQGWNLLAFISDPRTGLGHIHSFRISNFELMKKLPKLLRTESVEHILSLPDFQERIQVYQRETEKYKKFLLKNILQLGNAILIDLRGVERPPIGNRFLEYVLYPEQNISIRLVDGKNKQFTMISVGHSIINRTSNVNVGSLTLQYGGGGHYQVGTCQANCEQADKIVNEMLQVVNGK
ncbi:MAG: exopolyphosphatase [Deltaproteobacteria bacterium]|nr:exopolyphosphatase [Deltaproteobacteria bacterium]